MAGSGSGRSGAGRSSGGLVRKGRKAGPPNMRKHYVVGNLRPASTVGGATRRTRTMGTDLTGKRLSVRDLATVNGLFRAGYGREEVRRFPDRARRMGFTTGIAADAPMPKGYRYTGLDRKR